MTLAFEPTEPDTMRRPPRRPGEPPLSGFLLWQVLLVSARIVAGVYGLFSWARQARGHSRNLHEMKITRAATSLPSKAKIAASPKRGWLSRLFQRTEPTTAQRLLTVHLQSTASFRRSR
jgi:hypothetical protein